MSNSDKTVVANFSVNPEQTGVADVPGVTVLLNKKTLIKQEHSQTSESAFDLATRALLEAGPVAGVFLSADEAGSTFQTQKTFGLAEHEEIFRGVAWSSVPGQAGAELLTELLKNGAIEIGPVSTTGIRRALRTAFAAQGKHWLTLFRSGPADRPDGIVVVVSPMRLGTTLLQTQQILQKKSAKLQTAA